MSNPRKGTFKQSFQQFVLDRCEKSSEDLFDNKESSELRDKSSDLYQKLVGMLSPEGQKLLAEYSDINGSEEGLAVEYAYMQGLKDGVQLHDELELSQGIEVEQEVVE